MTGYVLILHTIILILRLGLGYYNYCCTQGNYSELARRANWVFVSLINVELWGLAFASGLKSDTGSQCVVLNMSLVEKVCFHSCQNHL